jgi:hypothetical protein|tara:strand:- start:1894 stop:2280 length:387 start_codon:yes stop_codon:yes gene_type:complete
MNDTIDEDSQEFPLQLDDIPVKLYKLISGESIIALSRAFDEESEGYLIGIEEPMSVIIDDDHRYGLSPWLPFASSTIHYLKEIDVLLSSDVKTDIKAHYMRTVLDIAEYSEDIDIEDILHVKGNSTTH